MTWKSGLREASLGGVTFHTRDRGHKTGRALVKHEYPKRDLPFVEDMGRDTESWTVDAYVLGDDYMSRRDALRRVCRKLGPMQYSDHWGVSARVVVESCEVKETSEEGRMARLSISLIEAGAGLLGGLAGLPATAVQLASAGQGLLGAGVMTLAANGLVGQSVAALATVPGLDQLSRVTGGTSSASLSAASLDGIASGLPSSGNLAGLVSRAVGRAAGAVSAVPLPQFLGPVSLPVGSVLPVPPVPAAR